MLLQFSVENFRSFKDRAVLSMEGSTDRTHPDNYVKVGRDKILKVATIFGANAAGKSNIFRALTSAILAVRQSNIRQVGTPLPIAPFVFDAEMINKPSKFEFVFISGGKKYVYGFSATSFQVFQEYLYVYNSTRATTIFERDENSTEIYKFTNSSLRREMLPLTKRNTKNKLFLATATEWNCEATRIPFEFFATGINTRSSDYLQELNNIGGLLEKDSDNSLKKFILEMLAEADINIHDFDFDIEEKSFDEFINNVPMEIRPLFPNIPGAVNKEYKINTIHNIEKNGNINKIALPLIEESEGTKSVFVIGSVLKSAFETGEVICIDEMDKSLHPALLQHIISLFNNPEINKVNAQLIISSHAMTLLSQEYLRRDQFYFVDKNQKTGESELYSLDEFSPRTREDIRKAYLLGRYGAVPQINEGGFLGI